MVQETVSGHVVKMLIFSELKYSRRGGLHGMCGHLPSKAALKEALS
jgi:hypothetical protein